MKNKDKNLLNEELKRHKQLLEYSFYVPEGDKPEGEIDNLILGEDEPEDSGEKLGPDANDSNDVGDEVDAVSDELGIDAPEGGADDAGDADATGEEGTDELPEPQPDEEEGIDDASLAPAEDEVELDITQLVQGTEEAKKSSDMANEKLGNLMGMVTHLENKLKSMDSIASKIDKLENELEKRAPTPEEKIEMRSLSSYPYNLKLTDFWADKEGKYDVMNTDKMAGKPKEYVLTKDDVENDYSPSDIKKSFDDVNDYEEEEF